MNKITINYGSDSAMTVGPHVIVESEEPLSSLATAATHLVGFMKQEAVPAPEPEPEDSEDVGIAPWERDRYRDLAEKLFSNIDWVKVGQHATSGVTPDEGADLMSYVYRALMDIANNCVDLEEQS